MFHVKQSLQTAIRGLSACATAMAVVVAAWIPMLVLGRYLLMGLSEWIAYRRQDGELIGCMRPEGEAFVPVDRLGRDLSPATDWLDAERTLDQAGIGYLAEPYELLLEDGPWQQVRVVEVSSTVIRLKKEDFGAVGGPREEYTVPFPAPGTLRAPRGGSGE